LQPGPPACGLGLLLSGGIRTTANRDRGRTRAGRAARGVEFSEASGDLSRCGFEDAEGPAPMTNTTQKTGAATKAAAPALIGMSLRQDIPGGLLSSRARFRFSCQDHSETRKPRCQEKRSEKRSVPFGRVSKLDTVQYEVAVCRFHDHWRDGVQAPIRNAGLQG